MYDSSAHQDTWRHSSRTCRSCNSKWQPVDFRSRLDRLSAKRRPARDAMIGSRVVARYAHTTTFDRVTNVSGVVWSEADPGIRGAKAYWIADGQNYFLALADALTTLFETPEESQSASASA